MTPPNDDELWCVDVVLRALDHDDVLTALVAKVAEAVGNDVPDHPVRPTSSYDMPPPDGSLGVSCWMRAPSVGQAADAGVRLVVDAAHDLTGEDHPLWDVRLLPASAVLTRKDETTDNRSRGVLRSRKP